jgi:hypothetical protein
MSRTWGKQTHGHVFPVPEKKQLKNYSEHDGLIGAKRRLGSASS